MRDYSGQTVAPVKDPITRDILSKIDFYLRDLSRGVARIQNGEVPDGSGDPIASDPFTGTIGSVIFIGADTELEEDNANFFYDNTNNRLGLGTSSPGAVLELSQASVSTYNRPTSTNSTGLWTGLPGSSSQLHQFVDEVVEDSSDYISQGVGQVGTACELNLGAPAGTAAATAVILRMGVRRIGSGAAGNNFIYQLNRSGTPIFSSVIDNSPGSGFAVIAKTLSAGEITTLFGVAGNLQLNMSGNGSAGGGLDAFDVDWCEIEWRGGPASTNLAEWNTSGAQTGRITAEGYLESYRLNLLGATSGTLTHIPASTTTTHSLTWPSANATGILANNGSGTLSWGSASALGLTNALLDGVNHTDTVAQGVTRGSMIVGNATPKWDELVIGATGRLLQSNGTDAAWASTLTGDLTFTGKIVFPIGNGSIAPTTPSFHVSNAQGSAGTDDIWAAIFDNASGAEVLLTMSGDPTIGTGSIVFPALGGTVVLTSGAQTLSTKTMQTSTILQVSTASTGTSFSDTTTATKRLRFVTSGAVGNNSVTLTNTAARNYGLGNIAGNIVVVGDDPPAVASGALGKVDLTGQVADIATTALSNTPPAGLYEVEVYLACTTSAVGAGTLTVTIGWTDVVGATTSTPIAAFALTATGRATGRQLCQVQSGNLTYAIAVTGIYSTSAYAVYARVKHLG